MKSTLAVIVAILIVAPPPGCWADGIDVGLTPQQKEELKKTHQCENGSYEYDGCCDEQKDATHEKCTEDADHFEDCNVCPPIPKAIHLNPDGSPAGQGNDSGTGSGAGAGSGNGSGAGQPDAQKKDNGSQMIMGILGGALAGGVIGFGLGMGMAGMNNNNSSTTQSQPVSNVPQKPLPGATQWCPGTASWTTSCSTAEIGPADVGSTASASASGSANATAAAPSGVGSSQAPAVVGGDDFSVQPLKGRGRRPLKRVKAPKTQDDI